MFTPKKKKKSNDFCNDATKADSVSLGDLLLQLQFRLLYAATDMTQLAAGSGVAVQQLFGVLLIFRYNLRAYVNMYVWAQVTVRLAYVSLATDELNNEKLHGGIKLN